MYMLCAVFLLMSPYAHALKIGIIGGGASGITLARTLRKEYGYTDITIFEKADTVSPITQTFRFDSNANGEIDVNDKGIDMTTNFIPTRSYVPGDRNEFTGVYSKLVDIIDEIDQVFDLNVTLTPEQIGQWSFLRSTPTYPEFLTSGQFTQEKIATDMVAGILVLRQVLLYTTSIPDVYRVGICQQGESVYEFGQRTGLEAFAAYTADLSNMLGAEMTQTNKGGAENSCAYVFRRSAMMNIDFYASLLLASGLTADYPALAGDEYEFVRQVLSDPTAYRGAVNFHHGYAQTLEYMAKIEQMNGVQLRLNAEVTSVQVNGEGAGRSRGRGRRAFRQLTVSGQEQYSRGNGEVASMPFSSDFNVVFVTARPLDILQFMDDPALANVRDLFDAAKYNAGAMTITVYNSPDWISDALTEDAIGVREVFADGVNPSGLGFAQRVLSSGQNCFPLSFYHDFLNHDYFGVNSFPEERFDENGDLVFEEEDVCIAQQLNWLQTSFGFASLSLDNLVKKFTAPFYPYVISTELEASDWWEELEVLQGEHNLFYFGEAISAQTTFGIIRYIDQSMAKVVPRLQDIEAGLYANANSANVGPLQNVNYVVTLSVVAGMVLAFAIVFGWQLCFGSRARKSYQAVKAEESEDEPMVA